MLDVKDTVLRRELASIALATRKTKNFFRGMLSAFRAGVSVVVGFHKPCCLVICSLQSPWLGVIFYPAHVVVGFHKPCCLVIRSLQSPWLGVIFYPAHADHTD